MYGGMTKKSFVEKVRRYRIEKSVAEEISGLLPKLNHEQTKAVLALVQQYVSQ